MTKNKNKSVEETRRETVTDIKIEKLIPNVVDNFLVTIFEDHHTIFLPLNITGTQFKAWKRGRGGVFSKDVLCYTLKKPHGKYVLIKNEVGNCVVRIITEEEELQFKTMKLIDGQIKDRPFMMLKDLQKGEKLANTQRYINEKDIEHEESTITPAPNIITLQEDDDIDHHPNSISLFSE